MSDSARPGGSSERSSRPPDEVPNGEGFGQASGGSRDSRSSYGSYGSDWGWGFGEWSMRHRRHGRWRGPRQHGPFRRAREGRLLGGVAEGLSKKTGVDVTIVRVAFVLFGLASGTGVAAYVLAWLFLPVEDEPGNIAQRAIEDRRGIALALCFVPALVVVLILSSTLGLGWMGQFAWPVFIGAAGFVLLWRNAPEDEREVLDRLARPALELAMPEHRSWTKTAARFLVGLAMLGGGLGAIIAGHPSHVALRLLCGVFLVVAAFVVVFGPWWLNVVRDLVVERQARALAEERANMATRVHDSVLQTLALIQRRADDPQQVSQLARAQERELRTWLFSGEVPGSAGKEDLAVSAGVQRIQREVEASHGITVEIVTVGDCDLDDNLRELLASAREATVNSAKWSGSRVVSIFAEVEDTEVSIFVRDRGKGFDPSSVPGDRKGLSESIRGRMARHGGTAEVRSADGEGTDVELHMPVKVSRRQKRGAAQ